MAYHPNDFDPEAARRRDEEDERKMRWVESYLAGIRKGDLKKVAAAAEEIIDDWLQSVDDGSKSFKIGHTYIYKRLQNRLGDSAFEFFDQAHSEGFVMHDDLFAALRDLYRQSGWREVVIEDAWDRGEKYIVLNR